MRYVWICGRAGESRRTPSGGGVREGNTNRSLRPLPSTPPLNLTMQHSDGSNSPSEEKMAYPEYKGHEEQLETVGSLTMMEGDGVLVRPARVFTADEERRLYTKVSPTKPFLQRPQTDLVRPDVLRRQVDKRILPILAFLYLLSFMDRGNVGNARLL